MKTIEVHGHRGSRGTHPENTLAGFREAVASGAEQVEFDIQMTKDRVPVVFHDPVISSRICSNVQGTRLAEVIPVYSLTLEELANYQVGHFADERYPEQEATPQPIPSFEGFLKWWKSEAPELGLNIEIKSGHALEAPPEYLAKGVVELVEEFDATGRCQIQSFDFRIQDEVTKLNPNILLSFLFKEDPSFVEKLQGKSGVVAPEHSLLNKENLKRAHDQGWRVIPWTVNETKDWDRIIDLGVDGIITDYPRRLRAHLKDV